MDPVSLSYYATICALLSLGGARISTAPMRLAIGALVGAIAVTVLPMLRGAFGI